MRRRSASYQGPRLLRLTTDIRSWRNQYHVTEELSWSVRVASIGVVDELVAPRGSYLGIDRATARGGDSAAKIVTTADGRGRGH